MRIDRLGRVSIGNTGSTANSYPRLSVTGGSYVTLGSGGVYTTNYDTNILLVDGSILPTNTQGVFKVELVNANFLVYKTGSDTVIKNSGTTNKIICDSILQVTGALTAASYANTSDYRAKEDIKPLNLEEYSVDNLNPVHFKFKDSGKESIGLIAHELQEHYPFLVEGEKDGEQKQSVNYNGLIGVLIKEIQKLKSRITILENKIEIN
jgi:hypothetical protein